MTLRESVTQNGEQPRLEVRPLLELALRLEGIYDGILHQIIGEMDVTPGQAPRERTQMRYHQEDVLSKYAHRFSRSCLAPQPFSNRREAHRFPPI